MTEIFDSPIDLTVSGGPVRLYRAGPTTAPAVLLLHGAMLDTAQGVWRRTIGELATRYHVHVIDMPRHGASRPWDGILNHEFYQAFIGDLLDALELPKVALVGLSMGGGIAVGYALENPARVSALIAVGPGGIGAKRSAQFLTYLALRTPGVMRLCSWYLARFPSAIEASMRANLTAGADTADFDTIVELASQEARATHEHGERALDDWQIRSYGHTSMRLNFLPELHRLAVPTLWVRGANDPLVGHSELEQAAQNAPGSSLITMPDAGHIVTYDQPDAFNDLALKFLAEHLRD